MGELGTHFSLDHAQVGIVASGAFYGYTISLGLAGTVVDLLGTRRVVYLALIAQVLGIVATIAAPNFGILLVATLLIGLGNGLVEAGMNPLVATLYPGSRTRHLNIFHAWFAGGLLVGGASAYLLGLIGLGWQLKMAVILIPVIAYGAVFLGRRLPVDQRVASGGTTASMYRTLGKPIFLILVGAMLLTGATELGPNQWIPSTLSDAAGAPGILVLLFINGIMILGRTAGNLVVGNLRPTLVMAIGSALACVGLIGLGNAHEPVTAFLFAGVFAVGISRFWPTMLALVADRVPEGGALSMAVTGAAGMLSTALILPYMGVVIDSSGIGTALIHVAVLPAILVPLFIVLWARERRMAQR